MRRPPLLSLAVLIVASAAGPASANEGRAEALGDNPMVRDDVDVVDFPGLLTTWGDLVFLTVSENASTGSVGAYIGRTTAFGLWVHRTPRFDDLAQTDALFDSFVLPETHHLADLMFGMRNGFGLRLSVAAGLDADDDEAETGGDLVSTGGTTVGVELRLGYSMDRETYHGDFGAGLELDYFEVLRLGRTVYRTSWAPSFSARHRSILRPRRPVTWVIDLDVARRAYTATATGDPEASGAFGRWLGAVVGGPRLSLPGGLVVWIGGKLGVETLTGEVDGQEQPSLWALGPGLAASAELRPLDLLVIRAAAAYDIYWATTRVPATSDDPARGERELGQRFHWSIGLGFELGGFRLDGTLAHELLFGGPESLGGTSPGFMGTVSASYAW